MNNIQKLLSNPGTVRLLIIIGSILAVLLSKDLTENFNRSMNGLAVEISGEKQPDSNIVILSISNDDIERSGGWPLGRNIYSEIINSLTELRVKKIGLGIILADSSENNKARDSGLNAVIEKSGKVILSSVFVKAGNENPFGDDFIKFSFPKSLNPKLQSGHLNFIQKNGIYIPSFLLLDDIKEEAFALKLADISQVAAGSVTKINIYASWKKFRIIPLTEFIDKSRNNLRALDWLKGKTVFIGTVDAPHAQSIKTAFDENLPGIGLQAIILDNLLTGRMLDYRGQTLTIVFSLLLLLITIRIGKTKNIYFFYGAAIVIFSAAALLSINFLFVEFNYAVFLFAWVCLVLYEFISGLFQRISE